MYESWINNETFGTKWIASETAYYTQVLKSNSKVCMVVSGIIELGEN